MHSSGLPTRCLLVLAIAFLIAFPAYGECPGFTAPMDLGASLITPKREPLSLADFDGDGDNDLAVTNRDASTVSILLGDGTGSFAASTPFPVGVLPNAVVVGDFDGDGNQDLATANLSLSVSVLLGNGDGTFQAATHVVVPGVPVSIATGDFDVPPTR